MNLNTSSHQQFPINKYSYLQGSVVANDHKSRRPTILTDSASGESLQTEPWHHHPARTELSLVFSTRKWTYDTGVKSAPVVIQVCWREEILESIDLQGIETNIKDLDHSPGPFIIGIVRMPSIGIKYLQRTAENQIITNRLQLRFDNENAFNGVLNCLKSYGINHRIINPSFNPTFNADPVTSKTKPIRSSTVATFSSNETQETLPPPKEPEPTLATKKVSKKKTALKRAFTMIDPEPQPLLYPSQVPNKTPQPQLQLSSRLQTPFQLMPHPILPAQLQQSPMPSQIPQSQPAQYQIQMPLLQVPQSQLVPLQAPQSQSVQSQVYQIPFTQYQTQPVPSPIYPSQPAQYETQLAPLQISQTQPGSLQVQPMQYQRKTPPLLKSQTQNPQTQRSQTIASATFDDRPVPNGSRKFVKSASENTDCLPVPLPSRLSDTIVTPIRVPLSPRSSFSFSQSSDLSEDQRDQSMATSFSSSATTIPPNDMMAPDLISAQPSKLDELALTISTSTPLTSSDQELRTQILNLLQDASFIDFVEKVDKVWNSLANNR